ncbi:MAG: hypothetical protein IPL83_06580 [Bdellovibrionales bacterium]|nr:hypothetical protein [Bdellovibrionales bacterium]
MTRGKDYLPSRSYVTRAITLFYYLKEADHIHILYGVFVLLTSLIFFLSLQDMTVPTFYQARDIHRAAEWWNNPVLHGPEFTYGGYIPGPLYYILASIPIELGGGWWTLTLIRLTMAALAGYVIWYVARHFWGNLAGFWSWLLYLNSTSVRRNSIPDWNASYQQLFSVLCVLLAFLVWVNRKPSKRSTYWYLFCLICSLGCQIHFSISFHMALAIFIQLFGPFFRLPRLKPLSFFAGILIFIMPMGPFLIWSLTNSQINSITTVYERFLGHANLYVPSPTVTDFIYNFLKGVWTTFGTSNFFFLFSISTAVVGFVSIGLNYKRFQKHLVLQTQTRFLILGLIFLIGTGSIFCTYPYMNRYLLHMHLFMVIFVGCFCAALFKLFFKETSKGGELSVFAGWIALISLVFGESSLIEKEMMILLVIGIFSVLVLFVLRGRLSNTTAGIRAIYLVSITAAFGLSAFSLERATYLELEGPVPLNAEKRIYAHTSARAIRWACAAIKQRTGWTSDDILERLATMRIKETVDFSEICKSTDKISVDPSSLKAMNVPSGYLFFRERPGFKDNKDDIFKWIAEQNLPFELKRDIFSNEITLDDPIFNFGVVLVPYRLLSASSSIRNFHNRARSPRLDHMDQFLIENDRATQSGVNVNSTIQLSKNKYLLIWSLCENVNPGFCRVGVVLDFANNKYGTVEFFGAPLNLGNNSLGPVSVQWIDSKLQISCGKLGTYQIPLLSKIGNAESIPKNDSFMAPMKLRFENPCPARATSLKFEVANTLITKGKTQIAITGDNRFVDLKND